jgi:hypothetical protein
MYRRADSPPLRLEFEGEGDEAEAEAVAAAEAHAAYSKDILLRCQLFYAAHQQKEERRPRKAAKKRKLASIKQREWATKKPPRLPRHPGMPRFSVLFPSLDPPRRRPQPPLRPRPKMPDDDDDNELCLLSD